MKRGCVEKVLELQNNEDFADLSIEQLLYACVVAVGLEETRSVLDATDWEKWCPNEHNK